MSEAGPLGLISDEESGDSDRDTRHAIKLPGVTKGLPPLINNIMWDLTIAHKGLT